MSHVDSLIAERLGGAAFGADTELYKFERIKRAKADARAAKPDLTLIDMGVGEPDQPADRGIVETLAAEAGTAENRWYADNGIAEFQHAAARYLEQVYGVCVDCPEEHIVHGIGSKPILAMLPLTVIDPGDVILTTSPGYPVSATYTRYLGGEAYSLPLLPENGFLPDLEAIPSDIRSRAKMLYLNYPNNPTGASATREFFAQVVEFALANGVVVVHDAAYGALVYDGNTPLSFLATPGAAEVGIEVHSLSKAFNMTGWRLAFAAGNRKLMKAYATVKDNTDSGQFRAIQKAGVYALSHPELTRSICDKYSRRFDLLVPALRKMGFEAHKPGGTFYCYVPAPASAADGTSFPTAAAFSEYLIRTCLVSTVPWDDAGRYIRFSVTFEADGEEAERRVIGEMAERMGTLGLRWDERRENEPKSQSVKV